MIKKYLLGVDYPSDPNAGKKLEGMWAMLGTQIRDFKYYYFLGQFVSF